MITENYIKMCEKAEEIQKAWKPKNYDLCINKEKQKLYPSNEYAILYYFEDSIDSSNYNLNKKDDYFWLPTLEQLFEILKVNDSREFDLLFRQITNFYWKKISRDFEANSLQEMLLKILMYKKYHKIWNGKDWIKENA